MVKDKRSNPFDRRLQANFCWEKVVTRINSERRREENREKENEKKKVVKKEPHFFIIKSPIPDRGRTLQAFDIQKNIYFVKDASSVNLHLTDLIFSYITVIIGVVLYEKIDMDKK